MEHAYKHVDGYQHVDDVATGMGCDFDALMLLLFGMAEGCGLCGHCVCAALEPANWLEPAPWMVMAVSEGDLSGMLSGPFFGPMRTGRSRPPCGPAASWRARRARVAPPP